MSDTDNKPVRTALCAGPGFQPVLATQNARDVMCGSCKLYAPWSASATVPPAGAYFGGGPGCPTHFVCPDHQRGVPPVQPRIIGMPAGVPKPAPAHQVGGTHYASKAIQPWDAMQAWMKPDHFTGFLWGNVIKYTARWQDKGGIEDLKKARHYLDKLIEELEGREG